MQEYSKLAADLEQQELESPNGIAGPQAYAQLLAIYLLQNDLPNAKFLWKRVPPETKQSHPEIGSLWKVGQGLWYGDFPAVYAGLNQEWPDYIGPLVQELGERTRRRAVALVSKAYSSISLDDAAAFLGLSSSEVSAEVSRLGWAVAGGMVSPVPTAPSNEQSRPCEEQLAELTDFVAFLES